MRVMLSWRRRVSASRLFLSLRAMGSPAHAVRRLHGVVDRLLGQLRMPEVRLRRIAVGGGYRCLGMMTVGRTATTRGRRASRTGTMTMMVHGNGQPKGRP